VRIKIAKTSRIPERTRGFIMSMYPPAPSKYSAGLTAPENGDALLFTENEGIGTTH
jgi:hypothetical protein